jgi:hypothetical protein
MHDTLINRNNINYDSYSNDEKLKLKEKAYEFLEGQDSEIDFDSIRMV